MSHPAPLLLLVDDDPLQHDLVRFALGPAWRVLSAACGQTALDLIKQCTPALVLMDLQMPGMSGEETAARMRGTRTSAAMPILAYSTTRSPGDGKSLPANMDGIIDKSAPAGALMQALLPWRPASLEPVKRIAAGLGQAAVDDMVDRLAARLRNALDEVYSGAVDRDEAHRLAGLCGTLGFADAHRAWLSLSEGDDSALGDVRRTTRVALTGIAQRA